MGGKRREGVRATALSAAIAIVTVDATGAVDVLD
jgi:hypothetical protein